MPQRFFRRRAVVALLVSMSCARAAIHTWDGGGTTNNLTDALNWTDDTQPPSDLATTDLVFAGWKMVCNA